MTNSQLYNAISATVTRKGGGNSTSGGQRGGRSVTGSRGGQTKRKAPAQSQVYIIQMWYYEYDRGFWDEMVNE